MCLAGLAAGCSRSTPAPPAAAEKPRVESELARTTLSATAVQKQGIQSAPVTIKHVQEHLPLTGWVMVRQGNEVTLTAPVAGYVREAGARLPIIGQDIATDQAVLAIEPVLSPIEQIQFATLKRGVENELAKARESLAAAESELNRVLELAKQGLRGQQDVEQARVRHQHAKEDLAAAQDKRKLFGEAGAELTRLNPIVLRAPRDGKVLTLLVSPGQYVPAAAPLISIADLSQLWVRVPVPEHYLPQLDRARPVKIILKAAGENGAPGKPVGPSYEGTPLNIVPQVDTVRHTADMIYDLARPRGAPLLAKDQMLTVFVPLGRQSEETVVPYDAIIFDAYAGTWVYVDHTPENAKIHVYERRRVELGATVDDGIIVRPKFKAGERVVTRGAAAIFSREFHVPPQPGSED
jgi:RND family efflux transporter MFP subunit